LGNCNIVGAFSSGGGGGGGASTAQYQQTSTSFSTSNTSLTDITNYSITLPTTTAAEDDCLCMLSYTIKVNVSDAAYMALTKNTTVLTTQRTDLFQAGEAQAGAIQFIADADGDTLKAQTMTAGGNTVTIFISSDNTPTLSAFAV